MSAALSLVLLSGVVLSWSRSLMVMDAFEWRRASRFVQLMSSSSSLRLIALSNMSGDDPPDGWHVRWWGYPLSSSAPKSMRRWFGGFSHGEITVYRAGKPESWPRLMGKARYYEVPHWVLAGASGALPGLLVMRAFRTRRRVRRRLCLSCGYDLRATPDRCPECGTLGHVPRQRPGPLASTSAGDGD